MRLLGNPSLVTVGRKYNYAVVTELTTDGDAVTVCSCGHNCTNPANCATWAHNNHARRHQTRGRNGSRS